MHAVEHAVELLEVVRSHSRNPYKRYGCEVKMKCKAMPRKDGNGGNPNDGAVAGDGGKGKKGKGKGKKGKGKKGKGKGKVNYYQDQWGQEDWGYQYGGGW